MYLIVTYPSGEFERDEDVDGDHSPDTADAHLATMPKGWLEATLHDDGDVAWRRFPASSWVAVKHWPQQPTDEDRGAAQIDVEALESWLRDIGIAVEWERLFAHPFPGHAIGGGEVEPDHRIRLCKRNGRSAIYAVLAALIGEGQNHGEVMHLIMSGCEHRREARAELDARKDAEMLRLRNEIRRLKGEPEMTAEQEAEKDREMFRAWVEETIAGEPVTR